MNVGTMLERCTLETQTNCSDTLPLFTGVWQDTLSFGEWRFDSPQTVNKYCVGVSDVTSQAPFEKILAHLSKLT